MAEVVELRSEEMIPEFEQMERLNLFDKAEIRKIIKKREEYEYKLQRMTKSKEYTLRYIQYEMDLLKLIRLRQAVSQKGAEKGLAKKINSVDYAIAKHIDKLYSYAISRFSGEVQIWLSYIKFCKEVKFYSSASRILEPLLQLHSDKPSLFKLAAHWEFDECQNIERARKFLTNGLHLHKTSRLLYKESFVMELNYAQFKRKEIGGKKETIDVDDPVLNGKLAEVIYNSAVKQLGEVEIITELLILAERYNFTDSLQQKILEDLKTRFPREELTWDTLARRELLGFNRIDKSDKMPLNERIKSCTLIYDKAVTVLNTKRMWAMFMDRMIELNRDTTGSLPNLRKNCLIKAFQGAHTHNMMNERYYLTWVDHWREEKNNDKVYEVLNSGTEQLPGSVTLWAARLKHHLSFGEESMAEMVFRKALAGLGDTSLPVWKLMLQYYQNTNRFKTEELFKEGIMMTPGISGPLKPMYLEWLTLSNGIGVARRTYLAISQSVPFCLEMHTKMAELEDLQPVLNLKFTRKCHHLSCLQFGSTNTDVWMAHVRFEQNYGNPKCVTDIFNRALKCLQPSLVDNFVSEFSLSKAETFAPSPEHEKILVHTPDESLEPMETN